MSKPGKVLKKLCKKLGVRLTVKQGKKRVYKSVKVLKKQCAKKKKKVKRKRKFGAHAVAKHRGLPRDLERHIAEYLETDPRIIEERKRLLMDHLLTHFFIINNPPPRLRRDVAQRLSFEVLDDDGFGF